MSEAIPERYENNPLFVILENYILHAIGRLEPEKARLLGETISGIWGGKAEQWKATVRRTLDLPETTDEDLLALWKQKSEEADQMQATMTPEDFARRVVDENYTHLNADL